MSSLLLSAALLVAPVLGGQHASPAPAPPQEPAAESAPAPAAPGDQDEQEDASDPATQSDQGEQEDASDPATQSDQGEQEDAGDHEVDFLEPEFRNRPRLFWDDGLRILIPQAKLAARIGGWLQLDGMLIGDDRLVAREVGPLENGAEVRRARLNIEGDAIELLEYRVRFEITGLGGHLRDFFVGIRKLPFRVRVGHLREPIGLEQNTNGLNTPFMERSLPTPRVSLFSTGAMVSNGSRSIFHLPGEVRRFTWAAGVFQNSNALDLVEGSSRALSGRVTGLPLDGTVGRALVHAGFSFSRRWYSDGDVVQLTQRPEANLAPDFLVTEALEWDRSDHLGLEAALIWERLNVQAEYKHTWGTLRDVDRTSFQTHGLQLIGSYFLTDDMRVYRYMNGSFGPVYPEESFPGGSGAIEIATRFSFLDLDDPALKGGRLTDWSLGANWYWTEHTRWSINFISARLHGAGRVPILQARFQIFV